MPKQAKTADNGLPPAVPAPWAAKPAGQPQTAPAQAQEGENAAPEAPAAAEPPVTPETPVVTQPSDPVPPPAPPVVPEVKAASGDYVTAVVPKPFILRLDHGDVFTYAAGTQEMPRAHAEHWYSAANGVQVYTPKSK